MLRGDRNVRKMKAIITILIFLGICGYGYYIFQKYKLRIIEIQEKAEDLQEHLREVAVLSNKVTDTAESIKNIFDDLESDNDTSEE